MKKIYHIIIAIILSISSLIAAEGDTIVIQTIDHNTPTLPGWNSPRSGTYVFPPATVSFSKILMSYNLKCDPSQSPACGEWDYTTHTRIYEKTGLFDSTLYFHPNFIVNNISPDTFMMMTSPSFKYLPTLEYINQSTYTNTGNPGDMSKSINIPFTESTKDGRAQFIYSSSELLASGLQAGDITGIQLELTSGSSTLKHFTIRAAHYSEDVLPQYTYVEDGLETVYSRNTSLANGNNGISFSFPFSWDGAQNILIDVSYANHSGTSVLIGDSSSDDKSNISDGPDNYLDFGGWDYVDVPKDVFNTIDSAITISFWQYGDPAIQPINSSIFEGVDSLGRRVLNAHLPWSNGKVYWDAGFDGYERIYRAASANEYKGKWNFWTFLKDCRTGSMQILLNGDLWFIGSGRIKPVDNVDQFRIGSAIGYDGYYDGYIDDFRIWDTVLSWDEIKNWMYKDITPDHPNYDNLRANYRFNDGSGFEASDSSPNGFTGYQFGYPGWLDYNGQSRMKNANGDDSRLHLTFENGIYDPLLLDSLVVVDTMENPPLNVVTYNPDNPPVPSDTLTRWDAYYNNYSYDASGVATDSSLVVPDETFYRIDMPYYGDPYEILIPWEIARYITPYGNGLSLGDDGWTWTFDVTDYRPLLVDSLQVTAGNFQELLDLEFHMIEGTPSREVVNIDKLYSGSFSLKNFAENVTPDTISLDPMAETFKVKTRTSGHQFDNPTNCAEFCYKIQSLDVNGQMVADWQIMQECANNPLHPQGGTWIYDRAGWCPGAKVTDQNIEITPYVTSDVVIIDYNSQYDEYGNYLLETHLISYGQLNFELDASVEEVIAPNNDKIYGRFNPSAGAPEIIIANNGSETLTDLKITYGPNGSSKEYMWSGNLEFDQTENVILEEFDWEEWLAGDGNFTVEVSNPNNSNDENPINNTYETNYNLPPVYPSTIVIHFRTNKAGYQNSWELKLNNDQVILERDGFDNETLYVDTITFMNGCFKFYMYDTGHNGISFWANNQGSGLLRWYDLDGNVLKVFNGDFGDQIYHSFYTDMFLDIKNNTNNTFEFEIIPNPNNGKFHISFNDIIEDDYDISVYNSTGQQIYNDQLNRSYSGGLLNLDQLSPGIYTCVLQGSNGRSVKNFVIN